VRAIALPIRVPFGAVDAQGDTPEATIVERLRRGDIAALGEAYERHHTHVRAFARRFLGEETAAEDLLQETFLALPGAIRGFRGDASLRAFLVGLALNQARHHLRSAARRRAALGRLAIEPPPVGEPPDAAAVRRQLASALSRALDQLPIEQRAAVVLCDVEQRSSAEAATIARVPEATVRTRLFHARRKLRDLLAAEGVR
jgi:RNA polymerase sigma-70 factor (ECF subfamily)